MAYIAPDGDVVNFSLKSYTSPSGDVVNFNILVQLLLLRKKNKTIGFGII